MSQTGAFATRVGPRLAALHPDYPNTPVFGLGSDDDGTYAEALQAASAVLELGDVPGVARIARGFVEPRLAGRTTIDAAELSRLTQADAARRYFGLDVDDAALPQFALCGLALGNYMFGVQATGSDTWRASRAAGAEISAIMRRPIAHAPAAGPNTLIGRLVASGVAAGDIEAMLTGFVAGWVGGATVAAIHALQVLLGRSRAMRAAREAAADCDDAALGRCLFEAIRFSPIFPGAFRDCIADYTIAAGTRRRCAVRSGDVVMPATHSAMFDGTRVAAPRRFDPDSPAGASMVLGYGRHFCIGHAFVTVVVPFAAGRAGDVLTLVRGMGNPAAPALRTSIESLDVVHFMSVNVIPADQGDRAHLLLEMSVDGPGEAALRGVAVALAQPLTDVLTAAGYTVSATGLPAFLSRHSRTLATTWYGTARSGGALGLAFCGSPNMPLRRIRDEAALGDLVADWSDLLYGPGPALDKLAAVRDRLWARGRWKWAFDAEQTPFLLPRRDDTPSVYARIFLASIPALLWPVLLVALLICALRWSVLHWARFRRGFGAVALLLAVLAAVLLVLVRRAEKTDIPEDVAPSPQHVAEVMDGENHVTLNLLI